MLWDARNHCLIAGRDRFGVKPLFYAEHNGALYLASEAKALFAMGVPAAWSHEAVYAGRTDAVPRGAGRAAGALPPGHA